MMTQSAVERARGDIVNEKLRKILTALLSIPWCCVVTVGIATLTTTGSLTGFFFDEVIHSVIPFLIIFHVYGIYRYLRHERKSRWQSVFLLFTTLLFLVSVGFHFTDLHDHLIGH